VVEPPERLSDALARVAEAKVGERWRLFGPECDERRRRLWAASEARVHGPGGVGLVSRATGISEDTIRRGLAELESGERVDAGRVRRPGGGRRPVVEADPTVVEDLQRLVDPVTRGDPESPLRWTSKSLPKLRGALVEMGHEISESTLGKLLKGLGYRLQANAKVREGNQHPDRDQQFAHINGTVRAALAAGQPVISVDTKKKELGASTNAGRRLDVEDRIDGCGAASEMGGSARWADGPPQSPCRGRLQTTARCAGLQGRGAERCGEGAPMSASGVIHEGERE
jgi:hypothetical protein